MLEHIPLGNLPAGWLENWRQVWEAPGVLSWYGGPREWGVSQGGCSLTSWSSLDNSRLCFRVPLRIEEDRKIWGQSQVVACRVG